MIMNYAFKNYLRTINICINNCLIVDDHDCGIKFQQIKVCIETISFNLICSPVGNIRYNRNVIRVQE